MTARKIYAGSKLREVRQGLSLTQKVFAERLSISLPYYCQMENNHRFNGSDIVTPPHLP